MIRPPKLSISYDTLPSNPKERHEVLVDAFGEYLFWVRRQTLSRIRALSESAEAREELGRLFRPVYEEASRLGAEDREKAYQLADAAVGFFARLLLTMISGNGFDDAIGSHHVFRFRLDMEICDAETGEVVSSETINRHGERFFAEYWGRWLNRFGTERD
ncbi:MAG TPA: hypothetical protein VND64_26275 [Pirellulales bacterium]|nr:hypothetical protein [Pirellulales bacterium]